MSVYGAVITAQTLQEFMQFTSRMQNSTRCMVTFGPSQLDQANWLELQVCL